MRVKFGVVRFPGTCDEVDAQLACERVGEAVILWHGDRDLQGVDAVVVPGGFSYGDYLRVGAIARFAPVMESVIEFARAGGLGARDLQRLPGAVRGRACCRARCCRTSRCASSAARSTSSSSTPARAFTNACEEGERLSIPAKHTTGCWYAPPELHERVEANGQVLLRYAPGESLNGSLADVAGVRNEAGNVFGLMPHPEHAVDPLTGSIDGLKIFQSIHDHVAAHVAA